MPTTYEGRRGAKALDRTAKKGDRFYAIQEIAPTIAPYDDTHAYTEIVCTGTHPLLGGPMFGHMGAEALVAHYGVIHTQPPKNIRNIAGPGPQVAGPLPHGQEKGRDLINDATGGRSRRSIRA